MASDAKITYSIIGNFALGGIAVLERIILGDGRRALLRRLQSGKVLNISHQQCFRRGTEIRQMLSPHPNLVNSLERGSQGLRPYEIIEFVDGQNLKVMMNDRHEVLHQQLMYIVTECAEALSWIHTNGFMHLDIKPENFILDVTHKTPVVKLTDFDLTQPSNANQPHKQMGTPAYMAPEQFTKKTAYMASDVFAFCIMLYQLTTGKAPFSGETQKEAFQKQASLTFVPKPPSEFVKDINPKLNHIIMTGLQKSLDKRYPSMANLLADLKR